jgi:hypothetical protein
MDSGQGIIHIKRTKTLINGSSASIIIELDDKWFASLKNGEEGSYEVTEGNHKIKVKGPFQFSPVKEFYINTGEIVEMECGFDLSALYTNTPGAGIFLYIGKHKKLHPTSSNLIPPKSKQISKDIIFISYRRSDSIDISGRIYDRLVEKYRKDMVFKDVDSIPLGVNFKEYLDGQVSECKILLAIIGNGWLDAKGATGNIRLQDPADFVRIEIESALKRNIPVIPLLVGGAVMPPAEQLPLSLSELAYRNGIQIRPDPDFHRDMDRLISSLEKYISPNS